MSGHLRSQQHHSQPRRGGRSRARRRTEEETKCGIYTERSIIQPQKEGNSDTRYDMDEPWGHYAKCNKPVTKGQVPHNSVYVRYLEESHPWRQKVEGGLPGAAAGDVARGDVAWGDMAGGAGIGV